ncbi:hypothetical protein MCOO_11720 [Mycobacterium cookii]|uniref:Uncharacterized protein n=1 Tax=Mycobacterium cookii TaxID=1775 RepID=A0A7I7KTL4_9MYCO|nr:hypothetical protein MCOO_11720 [Mycobacterium cookii]
MVVVAVDDAAAHGFFDVGDLELPRRLRTQSGRARHLQIEQLRTGDQQCQEDDTVADSVPENERGTAIADLDRLAGTTFVGRMAG